jgi:hypothetical protein
MNSGLRALNTSAVRQLCRVALVMIRCRRCPPSRRIPVASSDAQSRRERGHPRPGDPPEAAHSQWRHTNGVLPTREAKRADARKGPARLQSLVARKAGRPERGSTRTAQFFLEATGLPDELAASPPGRCYSRRLHITASLNGLKGVLNPKAQVHARRGVLG